MKQAVIFIFAVLLALNLRAADVEALAAGAKADLQKALAELAATRQEVEAARIPLAQKLNETEQALIDQRAEFERAQRFQENQLVELNVLKAEVKRRGDEVKYVEALLGEYLRGFETRIHISEAQRYDSRITTIKNAAANTGLADVERIGQTADLLELSLQRLEGVIGGEAFEGKALTPQGKLEKGKFTLIGPVALFASSESPAVGLTELQLGSPEPAVLPLPEEFSPAIKTISQSGSGLLPLDSTMGTALKLKATEDTLVQHILKGGPVMVPIVLLGLCSALIFIARWLVIGRIRVAGPMDLQVILNALRRGDKEKAEAHAKSIRGPVGEMLTMAIEHYRERKEYVEEVMYEKMLDTKPKLEKLLPFLALAAAAAPLLGLLGTVTGMINTFNMITVFGTGDPKTLAGGISEALITTEYGLIVAIPSLLLHAILSRRVKGVLASMEQTTVGFINGLPAQSEETLFLTKSHE